MRNHNVLSSKYLDSRYSFESFELCEDLCLVSARPYSNRNVYNRATVREGIQV